VLANGKSPVGEITAIVPSANGTGLSIAAASKPYAFNGVTAAVALGLKYSSGARQVGFELDGNLLWLNLTKLLEGNIEAFPYEATALTLRAETRAEAQAASGLNIDNEGFLVITGAEAVNAIEVEKVDAGRARDVDALGADLSQFSKHFGTISGMTLVDEGTLLTWSHDFTVRLWNISDRSQRAVLVGAKNEIVRVVTSAHGGRIAAAAGHKVLVWDPRDPNPLAIYQAPGEVADIAYSPDGTKLAAATASGQLVVWDQFEATRAVVDFAKSIVNRCLTRVERREFALEETGPSWCTAQRKYPFRSARLGIQLRDADGSGAKIVDVTRLPALAAGLRKDDIIYQVGTEPTGNSDQVTKAIQQSEIGKELQMLIRRDGKQQTIVTYPGPED
jgi:hypothetical protein